MKILIAFLTSAALATASLAAPPAAWIQVKGGAWNPDAQITADMQSGIQSYVEAQAVSQGRTLRLWAEYSFQYQGKASRPLNCGVRCHLGVVARIKGWLGSDLAVYDSLPLRVTPSTHSLPSQPTD